MVVQPIIVILSDCTHKGHKKNLKGVFDLRYIDSICHTSLIVGGSISRTSTREESHDGST